MEEGLNLRSKRPRRSKAAAHRSEGPEMTGPHECLSMDVVADQVFDGRRFRALTLVDNFNREWLGIEVGQSLMGFDVVDVMKRTIQCGGLSQNGYSWILKRMHLDGSPPVGLRERGNARLLKARKTNG